MNSTVEVEGVAASFFVVAWLLVFEFVGDCFVVFHEEVEEGNFEGARFFGEEVLFVFDGGHFLAEGEEFVGELF